MIRNPWSAAILCGLAAWAHGAVQPVEKPGIPLSRAVAEGVVTLSSKSDTADLVTLRLVNPTAANHNVSIPAGLIWLNAKGSRTVTLMNAAVEIPAGGSADVSLPAAYLDLERVYAPGDLTVAAQSDPRLDPLCVWLSSRPNVPRATSQLVALALIHDVGFARWIQSRARPGQTAVQPTPSDVVQAVDALAILKEIAPDKALALREDAELKLRALRNPWARAKAMQLYGMSLPGDTPADAPIPPDLGQLLHTKDGDNCPICRVRARMEEKSSL